MVSETSEINLPDTFVCPADMPDDQCGALNDLVVVSGTTGEVICTVCSAVLGIKEEEEDGEEQDDGEEEEEYEEDKEEERKDGEEEKEE